MLVELAYGMILAASHFFNDSIDKLVHPYRNKFLSFGAGISIAYLFLFLFPELYRTINGTGVAFISVLVGFALFHTAEKHVYQHRSKGRILRELKEVHSIAFFGYHFLIGITIFFFAQISFYEGLLFFIPMFLHTAASNISLSEIHEDVKESTIARTFLSLPSLGGIIFASFVPINELVFSLILGFVIGALLYVVVRDTIPKEQEGSIRYFLLGTSIMLVLVIMIGKI